MTAVLLKVPEQLFDPYFFGDNEVYVCPERYMEEEHFFAYEVLYYNGIKKKYLPWLYRDKVVKDVIDSWNKEQGTIKEKYKSRDKSVQNHMKKGIALFYMLLFWSNSVPVSLREWHLDCKDLSLKPVNVEERVTFIRQNTKLYHSYVQLTELFQEQYKQVAKDRAIINLKKNIE
ncbi:hypothetical protein HP456_01130 [Bacillus haikouensis]|uniref:YpoC family protein n=1 Tax=Bacillus haikouensis TaxID=1510468 RepID=UPI0015543C08|nr:hypothetical protein [Bacillus haikouensis]NQD64525.1 hypothetical protein [Bacillus haikouensis]